MFVHFKKNPTFLHCQFRFWSFTKNCILMMLSCQLFGIIPAYKRWSPRNQLIYSVVLTTVSECQILTIFSMLTWSQTPVAGVTGQGPLCTQLLPPQPSPLLIGQLVLISPLIGPQCLVSHPWLIVNSTVGRKTAGNISAALSDDFTSSLFSQTQIQKVRIIIINLLSQPGTWDCKKTIARIFSQPFSWSYYTESLCHCDLLDISSCVSNQ